MESKFDDVNDLIKRRYEELHELNEKGYIVPGLGDAGDLAFGEKLQH